MEHMPTTAIFVDPQCPFAWITFQWLQEVRRVNGLEIRLELMSLSCLNEGRELDPWYRTYNDEAWAAARVAAALLKSPEASLWPTFYEVFGGRRHVQGIRDNPLNLERTISELGLPADLLEAAAEPRWDRDLRERTARAIIDRDGVAGTPMLHLHGRSFFGPVLTEVPHGADAVRLWDAIDVLSRTAGFSSLTTERSDELQTS